MWRERQAGPTQTHSAYLPVLSVVVSPVRWRLGNAKKEEEVEEEEEEEEGEVLWFPIYPRTEIVSVHCEFISPLLDADTSSSLCRTQKNNDKNCHITSVFPVTWKNCQSLSLSRPSRPQNHIIKFLHSLITICPESRNDSSPPLSGQRDRLTRPVCPRSLAAVALTPPPSLHCKNSAYSRRKNTTLLEFTTTGACKIEFLWPHLGGEFSISQVLLLLA